MLAAFFLFTSLVFHFQETYGVKPHVTKIGIDKDLDKASEKEHRIKRDDDVENENNFPHATAQGLAFVTEEEMESNLELEETGTPMVVQHCTGKRAAKNVICSDIDNSKCLQSCDYRGKKCFHHSNLIMAGVFCGDQAKHDDGVGGLLADPKAGFTI